MPDLHTSKHTCAFGLCGMRCTTHVLVKVVLRFVCRGVVNILSFFLARAHVEYPCSLGFSLVAPLRIVDDLPEPNPSPLSPSPPSSPLSTCARAAS